MDNNEKEKSIYSRIVFVTAIEKFVILGDPTITTYGTLTEAIAARDSGIPLRERSAARKHRMIALHRDVERAAITGTFGDYRQSYAGHELETR